MDSTKHTLPEILFKGLKNYPEGLFSSSKRGGKWYECDVAEFMQKVVHFTLGLYDLGVRAGDKVSIHSESSTEWLICDLAILSIGAADVPIYSTQPGDQIQYILENSGTKVHIVSTDERFSETKPLIQESKSLKAIISIYGSEDENLLHFDDVLEKGKALQDQKPGLFDELKAAVKPDDLATLIYTSGTTGLPKGVMLSHNNIASNVLASMDKLPFDESEFYQQKVLAYLPLSHVFERMIDYMYISMGCKIYYTEFFDEIMEDLEYVQPIYMATVPRFLEKIQTGAKVKGQEFKGLMKSIYYWAIYLTESYDPEKPPKGLGGIKHLIADKLVYHKIRDFFGGHLRGVVSGGAALSPEVFKFMNAIGLICIQGYGLTETSPVLAVQKPGEMRVGSSGKPLPNVEIRIADDGEVLAKGPNVMMGYYDNEEKTKETFTEDGWLKTGDVGEIDKDGFLFITDRKKSMFKLSTGKYVAPQNVENRLINSGFIEQVVVIGYQRKFCSALIVPTYENVKKRLKRDGYEPSEPYSKDKEIRKIIQKEVDKINRRLSPWETVKKFVLLENKFTVRDNELTTTLKVKRDVVNEKHKKEIESMYEVENE